MPGALVEVRGQLWKSVLSFYLVGPWDQTWVVRLGDNHFYPLREQNSPQPIILCNYYRLMKSTYLI